LREAERWAGEHPQALLPREEAFLARSRRRRRSTRWKLGALVLVTALVTIAAVAFLTEWRHAVDAQQVARSETRHAVQAQHTAQSQALAAEASAHLSTAPQTALAEAVDAFGVSRTPQAEMALREAILANPAAYVIPPVPDARTVSASILGSSTPGGTFGTLVFSHLVDEALAFSADGKFLLGRALDGSVRLWRAANGRAVALPHVARFRSAGDGIEGVGFAGDVPLALLSRRRGAAEVLNLAAGRPFRGGAGSASGLTLHGTQNRILTLEHGRLTSGSGKWSVSVATANTAVTVERSDTKRVAATIPGFGNLFSGISVPVGDNLFEGTPFDPAAAFSPDDRLLAVANADGIVRVWEFPTLQQVMAFRAGWVSALAFAPSGGVLAAMTWDGAVVVARMNVRGVLPGLGVTISPTGELIAVGGGVPGPADLFSLDGKLESVLTPPNLACVPAGRWGGLTSQATFSPDGSAVAVAAGAWPYGPPSIAAGCQPWHGVGVWRVGSQTPVRQIRPGTSGNLELSRRGAFFVDGRTTWSTRTGAPLHALDGTLALSQDGHLALVSHAGTTAVAAVPSGRPVAELHGAGRLSSAAFSPDGRRLLTQHKSQLDLWDAASGRRVARIGRPGESVKGYAFGAGGRLVLALFGKRAATIDAATGTPVATVNGDFAAVSPDGSVAISLGGGAVSVVDTQTGVATALQTGTPNPIAAVHFLPDSSDLVAEDNNDKVVRVLRCAICAPEDELVRRAQATLAVVSAFHPRPPPVSFAETG
jgi:WD40 repeat protein